MLQLQSKRAAILSIGDELVLGQAWDTNSAWLSHQLLAYSIVTTEHRTVADDRSMIADTIRSLAEQYNLLLITGGLGPTQDDLTRDALGDALNPGEPLVEDRQACGDLVRWFEDRGLEIPETNYRQILRPNNMMMLPNPHGTAPGLAGKLGECQIFALPGPPREMQSMFLDHVAEQFPKVDQLNIVRMTEVHEYGMGEAEAAQRLGKLTDRDQDNLVGTTASEAIITARIRAHGTPDQAEKACKEIADTVDRLWQPYSFGREGITLASAVGGLLLDNQLTLVTAESCTGGWLSKTIVDVPGSSGYFLGGWTTYANSMKQGCLHISQNLLQQHGAVSEHTARAMAEGALVSSEADLSVAITGIAGPGGGTLTKPVGTVFIAICERNAGGAPHLSIRQFKFLAERLVVRDRAVKTALQMLRFTILNLPEETPLLWQV